MCHLRTPPPPNGAYEWSPLLKTTGQAITYWKLRLQLHRSNIYTSDRLKRLARKLSVEDTGANFLQYVEIQLRCDWQALRKVQTSAAEHKASHIEVLAEHFAGKRDTTICSEMK